MKPSEVLEWAKTLLVPATGSTASQYQIYICHAIHRSFIMGITSEDEFLDATKAVMSEIYPSTTLAAWVHNKGQLPESAKHPVSGYNLHDPKYIEIRDEFLNALIFKLKMKGL